MKLKYMNMPRVVCNTHCNYNLLMIERSIVLMSEHGKIYLIISYVSQALQKPQTLLKKMISINYCDFSTT